MSTTRDELLRELVSCRAFIFRQLADFAEEQGEVWEARAWKWLAKRNKWPSPRVVSRQVRSGGGNKTRNFYGWSFSSRYKGTTTLPSDLLTEKCMTSTPSAKTEEEALLAAVQGIAKWLKLPRKQ